MRIYRFSHLGIPIILKEGYLFYFPWTKVSVVYNQLSAQYEQGRYPPAAPEWIGKISLPSPAANKLARISLPLWLRPTVHTSPAATNRPHPPGVRTSSSDTTALAEVVDCMLFYDHAEARPSRKFPWLTSAASNGDHRCTDGGNTCTHLRCMFTTRHSCVS
ncbi:hypothetical protein BDW22DRAFT_232552 [Trametopsis cervina]|nr:hypothetical protein BDW22DRAFT_232552 [Trametopsis cervina]